MINALSYIGVHSAQNEDWKKFATRVLGMQLFDYGGQTSIFRMDNQAQRLFVSDTTDETIACIGWEVEEKSDLDKFAARIEDAKISVNQGDQSLISQRFVSDLIWFIDPAGFRIELVWKPEQVTEIFSPGRPIDGFKTGPLGMGHVVLYIKNIDQTADFYKETLGFCLSDFGKTPIPLFFFHVNQRHHSLALIGSNKSGFHHFMVEYDNLDDVGQGYDLAQTGLADIAYTIGRHTNDYMVSYYAYSPSGFFVESGWGGRLIDPVTWSPHESALGPSFWGHERLHMSASERRIFRDKRLETAKNDNRAPPLAHCPWLFHSQSQK